MHSASDPPFLPFFSGRIEGPGDALSFDAWADRSLLDSMEAGALEWPSSCRNGTCRTCLGHLVSGQVQYKVEWPGLSSDELTEGCVLPCVAHPLGDVCLRRADGCV